MVVSASSSESALSVRSRFVDKPFGRRDEILSRLLAPRRLCRHCQAIACLLGRTLTVLPMMMVVVVPIILQYVSIRVQAWPKRLVLCDPYEKPYQPGPPQLTVSLVLCVTLRSCYFMRSLARRMLGRPFLNLPSVINKDEHGPARIPHMRSWLEGTYGKNFRCVRKIFRCVRKIFLARTIKVLKLFLGVRKTGFLLNPYGKYGKRAYGKVSGNRSGRTYHARMILLTDRLPWPRG